MSQECHFEEGVLVDLFCGDCSFEEEVGADDDDPKDNDCASEVELEVEVEVEVVQETMFKHRCTIKTAINKKTNLNQMSEDELAAQLDELIKNESMQDFFLCPTREGWCLYLRVYLERGTIPEPRGKTFGRLKIEQIKS